MKIYTLDYLINNELTDEDLHYLFDCNSLKYSLVIAMIRFAGYTQLSDNDISEQITKDNKWIYNFKWTKGQFKSFENKLVLAIKNIFIYNNNDAKVYAENWMIQHALSIKIPNSKTRKNN